MDWLTESAEVQGTALSPDSWGPVEPKPPARKRRWAGFAAAFLVALLVLGGLVTALVTGRSSAEVTPDTGQQDPAPAASGMPAPPAPTPDPTAPPVEVSGTALQALETLPIKGRGPKTGDHRDAWNVWSDYDGNGCDERQDTLARDLTDVQRVGCDVVGGTLVDPYTGTVITVPTADPQIDIDHIVALSDAWQKGASGWSAQQMQTFASDPLNLLAVSSSANRSKSDGDAATWLPANKAYRCDMVARQIAVKQKYGLSVTQAEHDAMAQVLSSCPTQQLPTSSTVPVPVAPVAGGSAAAGASTGVEVDPSLDPQFPSCKALHAAGYSGGYVSGQDPEYDWYRDADHDGVVCE